MNDYRYAYQPRRKYVCPNCGHKTLKRFIDTTTNQLCSEQYGVCERIFNCGYERRPATEKVERVPVYQPPKIPFYFKAETMAETLNRYENNVLFNFLCKKFDTAKVRQTFDKYKVGTNDWGDTIFWQVTKSGRIVAGKKIQYFSNGKRNKARGASWLHNSSGFDFATHELTQTLFGSHLINDTVKTIRVVESEKTALIADIVKRDETCLFLATGGLQNLGLVANINHSAKILCIPDNDGGQIWQDKINKLNLKCEIEIIPKLQQMPNGSDIADLILNL